jgi:hypothetical protein
MVKLYLLLISLLSIGCASDPKIIPDVTGDSVLMMKLKHDITNNSVDCSYGWLFWYVPIALVLLMWAYREFIKKGKNEKNETKG